MTYPFLESNCHTHKSRISLINDERTKGNRHTAVVEIHP